jgi:hypothetical protein
MLLDFLSDAITNMDGFREDIATVYIYREERSHKIVATGNHPRRLLFYRVEPKVDLSTEVEAPIFLGALGYLRSMLSLSLMKKDPQLALTYRMKNGDKVSVESMRFTAERFESQFQCTNPDILNEKDRVRQFPRPHDAVFFPITKTMRKEFEDVARCGTPKADARLFTLAYDGTYVRALFGTGTHISTLVLTTEITGEPREPFSRLISLDRFRVMLKLASDNTDAKGAFHPQAAWIDFTTQHALHSAIISTIREQPR